MPGRRVARVEIITLTAVALTLVAVTTVGCTRGPVEPPAGAPGGSDATVVTYGRGGTFGALGDQTPSGQSLAQVPVPEWQPAPGRQAHRAVILADGTVLMGTRHTSTILDPAATTSPETVIGAYRPGAAAATKIPIRTSTGLEQAAGAPTITDLEPIGDGNAVAFLAASPSPTGGGDWPAFGILTQTDGGWQVASGPGWANQWTAADLPDAVLAGAMTEMVRLPSGDIVVTQLYPGDDRNGALLALRATGPDQSGRFGLTVTGRYVYPAVTAAGGAALKISPVSISADPTAPPGSERFAVTLLVAGVEPGNPQVLQEFAYDGGTGHITPISAPVIPGDRMGEAPTDAYLGYGTTFYDRHGNLWVGRTYIFAGGTLALYVTDGLAEPTDGQGGPSPGRLCPYDPGRSLSSYLSTGGEVQVWGATCPPDYDILQARAYGPVQGIAEDPQTGDIVVLHAGGVLLPIRQAGAGRSLTFDIGNQVDLGQALVPFPEGGVSEGRLAGFDSHGRLWIISSHLNFFAEQNPTDHWLYAIRLADLFDPPPVLLPGAPGESVTLQAEYTSTTSTTQHPGRWATVDVDSDAYRRGCTDWPPDVGCTYDGAAGDGFVLGDDTGFGHLSGAIEYRIEVPAAGAYRVSYRVATFAVTTNARIELTVGDHGYLTVVSAGGGWTTIEIAEPVTVPAGVHALRLSVPDGGGGWYLNSIRWQRV